MKDLLINFVRKTIKNFFQFFYSDDFRIPLNGNKKYRPTRYYADSKTARLPIVSNGLLLCTPPFPLFSNLSIDIVSRYDRLRGV